MRELGLILKLLLYVVVLGGSVILVVSVASFFTSVPYIEGYYHQDAIIKAVTALAGLFFVTAGGFILWIYHKIEKILKKQKGLLEMLQLKL